MALGVVGLSFGDFCRLRFDEFEAVLRAHNQREEMRERSEWERMRLHAVMTMQPHCGKKLDPRKLLPFDWERPHRPGHFNSAPELSKAEAKEAFLKRINAS